VSGGGGWCGGYNYLCDCASAVFTTVSGVTGASGRTLIENYSIAVDPNYIPLGWYVWIDSLNGWYRADDTGGAISGYHIDVYTGFSNPSYYFTSGIYLTSTPHAHTDPSPYGSGTVPSQPSGLWPDDWMNVGGGSVTLSWNAVSSATAYEVYILYWNGSDWEHYYTYYPGTNYIEIWPAFHGAYYAWVVKGINGAGTGPQSDWAYFYEQ
jgi:3D (Asp-Asp-Asp) domain-containing protein